MRTTLPGNDPIEPRLVDMERGAQALGVGMTMFKELIHSGQIDSVRLGRRRLIRVADLDAYVARLEVKA